VVFLPPETDVWGGWEKGQPRLAGIVIESRHRMNPERQEELWQKLEAELRKHGLEVAFRDAEFRSRDFIPRVRHIGGKQEVTLRLSYICLDDWRQNEIDAASAAVKKALKPLREPS